MVWDIKEITKEIEENRKEVSKIWPEVQAFTKFTNTLLAPGALDVKTKELLCVAVAVYTRCKYCIVGHVRSALKAGASKEEVMEAALVAVEFGGGPALTHCITLVNESIKLLASELDKNN